MDSDTSFSKYDDLILETLERYHVPGTSIAVVDHDKTWSKAYGIARYPEEKVTIDTLFNAASMSKAFVSAGISLLVDDEAFPHVKWSTPVSQIIPDDFVLSVPIYTEMVTVDDILSHRSGLPDQDDACFGIHAKITDTPKSCTCKLRHLPLSAPLRTKFQYCNLMYVVGVHMIETLTAEWMGDFLRERIWRPLKMTNTYFGNDDAIEHKAIDRLAKGYGWDEDKATYFDIPWPVQPEAVGAGEILSTAKDYAKFLRCMIHKSGPISAAGHEELIKPRSIKAEKQIPFLSTSLYALGWCVESYHGETIISHGGATNGFRSQMWYLPRLEWGIVIFTNSETGSYANSKICFQLIDDLLEVPKEKRYDWDRDAEEDMNEPDETIEDLCLSVPDPPLPPTLPLPLYAGSYFNKGYGTLVIEDRDGVLIADGTDRTWRPMFTFKHISGDIFAVKVVATESRQKALIKGRFTIDARGSVAQVGLDLVKELEGDMIWFKRD